MRPARPRPRAVTVELSHPGVPEAAARAPDPRTDPHDAVESPSEIASQPETLIHRDHQRMPVVVFQDEQEALRDACPTERCATTEATSTSTASTSTVTARAPSSH
jgi:hypothetical protein